jgi:hypothetical protein
MKEQLLTKILNRLAEEGVPSGLDLRPVVHRRLETSKPRTQIGAYTMKVNLARPHRMALIIASAALVLAVVLLLTPQGRAWSQEVISFFTHADQDQYPKQPFQMTPLPPSTEESPYPLTLEEAQDCGGSFLGSQLRSETTRCQALLWNRRVGLLAPGISSGCGIFLSGYGGDL